MSTRSYDVEMKSVRKTLKTCVKNDILQKNLEIAKLKAGRSCVATFHKNKSKELTIDDVDVKIQLLEENLMSKNYKLEAQYSDVKNSLR